MIGVGGVLRGARLLRPGGPRRVLVGALGYEVVEHEEPYVALRPRDGESGPMMLLQRVPEPKTTKNRMHIDLRVADIEAEANRLTELGAERLGAERGQSGWRWIVMTDPEDNEFCVCRE